MAIDWENSVEPMKKWQRKTNDEMTFVAPE
jgi:hypothetical protein